MAADGISKSQAAKQYNVSTSDVEKLKSVGSRHGQYGSYKIYSHSQLASLEARKEAQKMCVSDMDC